MSYKEYAEQSENDRLVFQATVWQRLTVATPEDVRYGRMEYLHTVAPIVAHLSSARRHEQSTRDTPGWRGGETISVVVISAEDQARVPALLRAWRNGEL